MCKARGEDIPELTERSVCRVKASSGAHYAFNRGGTVEFMLHPQCSGIEDEVFYFSAERRLQNAGYTRGGGKFFPPNKENSFDYFSYKKSNACPARARDK